ncbi:hybrid sensor histidine kinase/response regulator [Tichowtungia aerotolerans]|uniref:histidine kinase n=1 Tax=Tichowtungia aerotolerans TaxID=2697043 RepID=A0A6P1M727_9BACT|nr:hybrid sensor histidine kinase/response regulator [Tichowtungia aerotolerans]QHI69651.1 response regulator [Tichowtungia aerotolerans]
MAKDHLLVIDDELGPRESLRFLFKDTYNVVCADSVDKGVEALKQQSPDCIITDIKMPGKSGIEGLKEIRVIDRQVSIIMLTGFGSLETAQEAIRHGATDYLQKPFNTKEIRDVVARYVQRTKLNRKQIAAADHLESLTAELQNQLNAKEKLAQLGEKSSEFVHDLNNPLSVINGYVQILIQDIRDKKNQQKEINVNYLEQIEKSVSRCQDMLTLWRERSQRASSSIQKIELKNPVTEVAANAKTLAVQKQAHVLLNDGPDHCLVEGDDVQIFRAIQNIVGNALEALPEEGGNINISWRIDGTRALVEVEDNGGGFPSEKLADMQTKYYTTKGQSGGMGLGLFITKNIVEAHGGSLILANNNSGTGALVTLAFPLLK